MKKLHLAFWIIFPIVILIIGLFILFIYDLLNGPLALFIIQLVALLGLVVARVILYEKKFIFRLIPWGAFILVSILCLSLSKTSVEATPAVLSDKFEETDVLTLKNGKIKGAYTSDKKVEVYAGVPYAKAPVGELRWKETQSVENWEGVKDCTYFAPKSMQNYSNPIIGTLVDMYAEKSWHPDYNMSINDPVSEDSLYLNIWRPANFTGKLPIIVYYHGGSLTTGSSYYTSYNGETFARNGVIMITVAYRLGVFGYFAHEDLQAESVNGTTGNYGLLDQIEALKWVNENADYFGGDKSNITIAGESAGSSSVSAICASPLASGLFQKAIGASSSLVSYRAPHTIRSMESAIEMGHEIMKEMGCSSIDELRKIPAEKLVNTKFQNSSIVVDGYALKKTPYEVYLEGENNEVALLNGYNVHEADYFVVPTFLFAPTNKNNIEERLGAYFDKISASEFMSVFADEIEENAFDMMNNIISYYWFMQPHYDWSSAAYNNGVEVYRYQFTKENGYYGTYHSGELIYAYGNIEKSNKQFAYDEEDKILEAKMVEYWTNFVKNGKPGNDWTSWDPNNNQVFELGEHVGFISEKAYKAYSILNSYKSRVSNL